MKFNFKTIILIALFSCLSITSFASKSGVNSAGILLDTSLYKIIYLQDSLLFDAFNSKDFELFKRFFSTDLEIYQDNIGKRDYGQSMDAFRGLLQSDNVLTRKLLKETLEVYPVKNYGAIEIGQHTFCNSENGKLDCGTYKFVHIWENQSGVWKITRIITYNH
jgi:hypothetical protein